MAGLQSVTDEDPSEMVLKAIQMILDCDGFMVPSRMATRSGGKC